MKKLTAVFLLVCLLMASSIGLTSCNDAPQTPNDTQPVVIAPTGDDTTAPPAQTGDPTSPTTPTTPTAPAAPGQIKNVIYIIGDGMGLDHVAAGQMMNQKHYGFTDWQFTTANTDSVGSDGYGPVTTDSAASGTALATGILTVNGYVGKDHTGADVTTILDYAKGLGKATGVLTTDTLTGATPAAFSAHNISRNNAAEIAASQLDSGVDLLGGHTANETANKAAAEAHGYAYCDDFSKIDGVMTSEKTYWQLDLGGTGAEVSLADATKKALAFLERDEDGFALMIEQAHVDKYAHSNDIRGAAESVDSLNDTVEAILAWLGDRTDTMIVITSDHETGGLSVSYEKRYSKSVNSFVTDASGNRVRVYYHFASTGHTNAKVGVFVYGVEVDFKKLSYYGVENTIKNIDIYDMLVDVLTPEQPAA